MISYIKGRLENINEGSIVVETGGIGYMIVVPTSVIARLPGIGSTVTIYTYMILGLTDFQKKCLYMSFYIH